MHQCLKKKRTHLLVGENIFLRKMEVGDEIPIYKWENNKENWGFGETTTPFSKEDIIDFVNAPQDILTNSQLRLMICLNESKTPIGCIDLFEFNVENSVAGVGILIGEKQYRELGYAKESLYELVEYCRSELQLKKLFCNISVNNTKSIHLFENNSFKFVDKRVLFNQEVNYYELAL